MSETMTRTIRRQYRTGPEGHISIGWDAEDDEKMVPVMQRLIDSGHIIWIVKRNPLREVELRTVADLAGSRHVVAKDPDLIELFQAGVIGMLDEEAEAPLEQERRTTDAREAASNDTVTHRPLRGG